MEYIQYVFGECRVIVDEAHHYIETILPDGRKVGATPNDDWESIRRADSLGYGRDTWAMSRDHELAHTWLAFQRGEPCSFTMFLIAHGWGLDRDDVREEEAEVLAFQKALDKGAERPWALSVDVVRLPVPW